MVKYYDITLLPKQTREEALEYVKQNSSDLPSWKKNLISGIAPDVVYSGKTPPQLAYSKKLSLFAGAGIEVEIEYDKDNEATIVCHYYADESKKADRITLEELYQEIITILLKKYPLSYSEPIVSFEGSSNEDPKGQETDVLAVKEALEGAKTLLKYASKEEKKSIQEYIEGLKILLES